jgi:hypothetical protein
MIIQEINNLIEETQYYTNNGTMHAFPQPPPASPPIMMAAPTPPQSKGLLKKALIGGGLGLGALGALGYAANSGLINVPKPSLPSAGTGTLISQIPKMMIPNAQRTYTV